MSGSVTERKESSDADPRVMGKVFQKDITFHVTAKMNQSWKELGEELSTQWEQEF